MMPDPVVVVSDASQEDCKWCIIINVFGSSIALILQLVIGVFALLKMHRNKATGPLKIIFALSFALGVLATTLHLIASISRLISGAETVMYFIGSFCFSFLWHFILLTLAGTLVIRLHVTFKGSALEMTKNTVRCFVALFVLQFIFCALWFVGVVLVNNGHDNFAWILLNISGSSFFIVYIIISVIAVRLFVKNLSQLTRLQICSQTDLSLNAQDVSLNSRQQRTSDLSSKYILLFFVATFPPS